MAHRWWAVIAATGVIIAALYLLWAYQRVFQGEPDEANKHFPDLKLSEKLVMVPLVVLIVFLGIYPKPVLDRIQPSVKRVVTRLELRVERFDEPVTRKGADLLFLPEARHGMSGEHSLGVATTKQGANQ